MRYFALATDFDGTLAENGQVHQEVLAAPVRLKTSGRKLLMVTDPELKDFPRTFQHA